MSDQLTVVTEGATTSGGLLVPTQTSGSRRLSTLSGRTSESGPSRRPSTMMGRKGSFKNAAMSLVHGMRKNSRSMSIFGEQKQHVMRSKMENTYCLKPSETDMFNCSGVHSMVKDVLETFLGGHSYNPTKCKELTQQLSTLIRNRVRELNSSRYKIVVNVLIGQNGQQEIQTASRAVWSTDTDNWVSVQYLSASLFALATVHAAYYE